MYQQAGSVPVWGGGVGIMCHTTAVYTYMWVAMTCSRKGEGVEVVAANICPDININNVLVASM